LWGTLAQADPQPRPLILLGDRDYPPLNFLEDGVASGVTVDIVRALSREVRGGIEIRLTDWKDAQRAVLGGEADGLIGMSVTEERKRLYDFSRPILTNEFSLFVRSGELRVSGIDSLAGLKVAVTSGGLPRTFLESRPEIGTLLVDSYLAGLKLLAAGQVDAFAGDRWVAAYTIEKYRLKGLRTAGPPFASLPAAIAVSKGNRELVARLDGAIARLEASGEIGRIRDKWRTQEMVFLSWGRAREIAVAASLAVLVLLGLVMAVWIVALKRQVRERRSMEKVLRENVQRFRAIFEHSGLGIAVVDMRGYPVESNPALQQMLGYREEELRSMPFTDFTHPEDRELDWELYSELVEGKRDRYQLEKRYLTAAGQTIWGQLTVSVIRDSSGRPMYCIGMVDDITERKQMQEVMIQTEKMSVLAGLAAGMAHEINNPLGIIVQNLQVLERRFSEGLPHNREIAAEVGVEFEKLQEYLERQEVFDFMRGMREAGKRASKVMNNVLQFSRKGGGVQQPVLLPVLCEAAIEMTRSDYDLKKRCGIQGIAIEREYADDLPEVMVNPSEIEQVLINLLKNAAQALSEGGSGEPRIRVSVRREGGGVEIRVADNGPGMSEETRRRIFEPFFTTKEVGVGTGLGLTVSYTIITKNHGGTIEVESSPGRGTCFTILLPLTH